MLAAPAARTSQRAGARGASGLALTPRHRVPPCARAARLGSMLAVRHHEEASAELDPERKSEIIAEAFATYHRLICRNALCHVTRSSKTKVYSVLHALLHGHLAVRGHRPGRTRAQHARPARAPLLAC